LITKSRSSLLLIATLVISLTFPSVSNPFLAGIGESEFGYPTVYGVEVVGQKIRGDVWESEYLGNGETEVKYGLDRYVKSSSGEYVNSEVIKTDAYTIVNSKNPYKIDNNTCELLYLGSNNSVIGKTSYDFEYSDNGVSYKKLDKLSKIPKSIINGIIAEEIETCDIQITKDVESDIVIIKKTKGDYEIEVPVKTFYKKDNSETFPSIKYTGSDLVKYLQVIESVTIESLDSKVIFDGADTNVSSVNATKSFNKSGNQIQSKKIQIDTLGDSLVIDIPKSDEHLLSHAKVLKVDGKTVIEKRFSDHKPYAPNQKFAYDPIFSSNNPDLDGYLDDNDNDNICDPYATGFDQYNGLTVLQLGTKGTAQSTDCARTYMEFDISAGVPVGAVVTDSDLTLDNLTVNNGGKNCDIVGMTVQTSDTTTNIWASITDDTVLVDNSNLCVTVATNVNFDLTATGDTYITNQVTSGWVSFGFKQDDETLTANNLTNNFNAVEGTGTPDPTLTLTYIIPIVPLAPTNDGVTDGVNLTYDWTFGTNFDNATQPAITSTDVYVGDTAYLNTSLKNQNATQELDVGAIETDVNFEGIFHFDNALELTPDYSDDFTTCTTNLCDGAYTSSDSSAPDYVEIDITNDEIDFQFARDTSPRTMYHDLGSTLDTEWLLRLHDVNISSWIGGHESYFGLASTSGHANAVKDSVVFVVGDYTGALEFDVDVDDADAIARAGRAGTDLSTGTPYYVELSYSETTGAEVCIYTDSDFSVELECKTDATASATSFQYLVFQGEVLAGSTEETVGSIGKVELFDGIISVPSVPVYDYSNNDDHGLITNIVGTDEIYDRTIDTPVSTVVAYTGYVGGDAAGVQINTGHSGIGSYIACVSGDFLKTGSPTGNAYFKHLDSSETVKATSTAIDTSAVDTSYETIERCWTTPTLIEVDDYIIYEYVGGSAGNYLQSLSGSNVLEPNTLPVWKDPFEYRADRNIMWKFDSSPTGIGTSVLKPSSINSNFTNEIQFINSGMNVTSTNYPQGTDPFTIQGLITLNQTESIPLLSFDSSGSEVLCNISLTFIGCSKGGTDLFNHTLSTPLTIDVPQAITIKKSSSNEYETIINGTRSPDSSTTDATTLGTPTGNEYYIGYDTSLGNSGSWRVDELNIQSVEQSDEDDVDFGNRLNPFTLQVSTGDTSTTYEHTGLPPLTDSCFYVQAENSIGLSDPSGIECGQTTSGGASQPTGLTVTDISISQLDLDWDDAIAADNLTGFRIFVESPTGNGFTLHTNDTGTTTSSLSDLGLSTKTQYNYMIAGINGTGVGANSTAVSEYTFGVPDAITDLSTGSTSDTVTLTWSAPTVYGFPITGYFIEYESPTGNGFVTLVGDTTTTDTTYIHTGLSAFTQYNYRVTAITSFGNSAVSNESSTFTVTDAPTSFTMNDGYHTLTTQLNLEWIAPTGSVNGYKIECESPTGNGFSDVVANTTTTTLFYNHTGLTPGQEYNCKVSAHSEYGTSIAGNVFEYSPHALPEAVDDLVATATSLSAIDLEWTLPIINSHALSCWMLNYTTPLGDPQTIVTACSPTTDLEYTITGLALGDPNSFRVSAVTPHGTNATGNIINATAFSEFEIGSLSITEESNPNILPVLFSQVDTGDTSVITVRVPNTISSLSCDLAFKFAATNTTYNGLATSVYDTDYDQYSFTINNATNEVIDFDCWDAGDLSINGQHTKPQSSFALIDMADAFRDGTFGTAGEIEGLDMITFIVIIVSMVGFNKSNPAAGILISVMILGATAYFGLIELPTILFSVVSLIVMLAIVITRKN
jgi:hypothetical protein